ncbi:MAG: hypothetical protein ACRDS9_01885 [Pseudonocardiaceae bacterium]
MRSMHYCQSCDEPHPMLPSDDGNARCARCAAVDVSAVRLPLLVLSGASGASKSALFPLLLERLNGRCAVFDVDWIIDPMGGVDRVDWSAFRDTWLHVAHGVAQNGLPTLLLGPFIPEHLADLPGRRWVDGVHFAALDCSPAERRARIEARAAWRARDIEGQQEFADWLRRHLSPVFDTSTVSHEATADAVASWVAHRLDCPGSSRATAGG